MLLEPAGVGDVQRSVFKLWSFTKNSNKDKWSRPTAAYSPCDAALYAQHVISSSDSLLTSVCLCVSVCVCAAGLVVSDRSGSVLPGSDHGERERHDHPDRAAAGVRLLNPTRVRVWRSFQKKGAAVSGPPRLTCVFFISVTNNSAQFDFVTCLQVWGQFLQINFTEWDGRQKDCRGFCIILHYFSISQQSLSIF